MPGVREAGLDVDARRLAATWFRATVSESRPHTFQVQQLRCADDLAESTDDLSTHFDVRSSSPDFPDETRDDFEEARVIAFRCARPGLQGMIALSTGSSSVISSSARDHFGGWGGAPAMA